MKAGRTWCAAVAAAAMVFGPMAHAAKNEKAAAKAAPAKAAAKAEGKVVMTDVPPPSGTWEGTPPPAQGYVWSRGYYQWKDGRYQWKQGEWVLDREGFDYRQHAWVQKGDKWQLTGGDWVPEQHAGAKAP